MRRASVHLSPIRPPLKWAGGKRWQVPALLPLWQPHAHRRLVEPFCGGLAVALGLRPAGALLADANPHLINFYRWLQRGLQIDLAMENDRAQYYRQRQRFNALIHEGRHASREAAELFYYLNRTGYNGLCRFNSRGEFNVPFGRYASIAYTRDFSRFQPVLAEWQFRVCDFGRLRLEPQDFVYADPPYDVPFTRYSREAFTWDDQARLARVLASHPGPVILVNQATPRVEALYRDLGYVLRFADAPRRINCTGDRRPAREIMATRNL